MAENLDLLIERIEGGHRLLAVQDDDVNAYRAAFRESAPKGMADRPVLAWDPEDGFLPLTEYQDVDELPAACLELADALNFILEYGAPMIFLLDCRQVDLAGQAGDIRKRLKRLAGKLGSRSPILVVLQTNTPISASLAGTLDWIGEAPEEASAVVPNSGSPRPGREFAELRSLERFDSPEWQERLEHMSQQEVEAIIAAEAHYPVLDRVNELRQALRSRFVQKHNIIDMICAAAVARLPTVLIGPPGTAKGHMIRSFTEGLGLSALASSNGSTNGAPRQRRYFEYLLTRYTTPEEIFGPIHVSDLINRQVYHRITDGYLPTAQVAFLDEIFKASSAILNTLLSILNERVFYNEGHAEPVPLTVVFAASNEAPTDESLAALYDRFPLRLNCPSVSEGELPNLLARSWEDGFDRQFNVGRMGVARCACPNDLRLLNLVMRVKFGGRSHLDVQRAGTHSFSDEFVRAYRSLRTECAISDRTMAPLLALARSQAVLANRDSLTVDELDVFRHVKWDETGELDRMVNSLKRGYRQ